MQVTVNGVESGVEEGTTVDALVRARIAERRHIAVAVNGAVVPRGVWAATELRPGDSVEVLVATAGG